MFLTSDKRLILLRNYILTVLIASVILIALRWDSAEGVRGMLELVSLCLWQAVVWPLLLIKGIFTP